jgi:23S rRNA pseudouridine1911/1915/1917 synthase
VPSSLHASSEHAGLRLDQFLVAHIPDVSRARVQQLIAQGKVLVDGAQAKASLKLRGTESIAITGEVQLPPLKAVPEDIPLDVVFEDDSLAVINKPAGMMVHAGAATSPDNEDEPDPRTRGTLVNALLGRFNKLSQLGGELRPGIVHRLDKDTSGLIIVAKSESAHRKLASQFSDREVKKRYFALVHGWPGTDSGAIHAPIGRDVVRRNRMSTRAREGRDAISHYKVMQHLQTPYGRFALLEVTIETGRTHQIRVHLASIGHPVVGDTLYGAPLEIAPLAPSTTRAVKANTKANRDRMASETARKLTESATGTRSKKKRESLLTTRTEPAGALSLNRNFLHAASVEFTHPKSGKRMRFDSQLPQELASFLGRLQHQT